MLCVVTAGPTYEPLDRVRRLTNFSTGRLGCELSAFLTDRGYRVHLLVGEQATYAGERRAAQVDVYSTTTDLGDRLERLSSPEVGAVFHAAAVSDFAFGPIWQRMADGQLTRVQAEKVPTRFPGLLVELVPTVKLISSLRGWFPTATLVGWKYEMDGDRSSVLRRAEEQIAENGNDACVANGAAYGPGFGLVTGPGQCLHQPDSSALFEALGRLLENLELKGTNSPQSESERKPSKPDR